MRTLALLLSLLLISSVVAKEKEVPYKPISKTLRKGETGHLPWKTGKVLGETADSNMLVEITWRDKKNLTGQYSKSKNYERGLARRVLVSIAFKEESKPKLGELFETGSQFKVSRKKVKATYKGVDIEVAHLTEL